jgi:hypothetical protein
VVGPEEMFEYHAALETHVTQQEGLSIKELSDTRQVSEVLVSRSVLLGTCILRRSLGSAHPQTAMVLRNQEALVRLQFHETLLIGMGVQYRSFLSHLDAIRWLGIPWGVPGISGMQTRKLAS